MFSLFKQHFTFHTWCLAGFSCSCLVFAFIIVFFFFHICIQAHIKHVSFITSYIIPIRCDLIHLSRCDLYDSIDKNILISFCVILSELIENAEFSIYLSDGTGTRKYSHFFPIFQRKKSFTVELLICFSIRFSSDSIHFAPTNFQRDSLFWEKKKENQTESLIYE